MTINIKDFNEKSAKGLARILEVTDDNIVVAYKDYDLEKAKIGEVVELPEQIAVQSKAELLAQNETLQAQIDENNSFLNLEVE